MRAAPSEVGLDEVGPAAPDIWEERMKAQREDAVPRVCGWAMWAAGPLAPDVYGFGHATVN